MFNHNYYDSFLSFLSYTSKLTFVQSCRDNILVLIQPFDPQSNALLTSRFRVFVLLDLNLYVPPTIFQ